MRGRRTDRQGGFVAVGLVAVLAGTAGAGLLGRGASGTAGTLLDGGAWLPNTAVGTVSHVSGIDGRMDTELDAHVAGAPFHLIQRSDGAYVVNETTGAVSRVDAAAETVTPASLVLAPGPGATIALAVGGGKAWEVDRAAGRAQQVDPLSLTAVGSPAMLTTTPVGAPVADGQGTLWAPVAGAVDSLVPGGKVVGVPAGGAGDAVAVTLAQGRAVAVDVDARAVRALPSGTPVALPAAPLRWTTALPGIDAGVLFSGNPDAPEVVAVDGTGLEVVDLDAGTARHLDVPATAGVAQLAVSGSHAYLVDEPAGTLRVVDLTAGTGGVIGTATLPKGEKAGGLTVKDGKVFVNDPTGAGAIVIAANGMTTIPVTKYTPMTHDVALHQPDPLKRPATAPASVAPPQPPVSSVPSSGSFPSLAPPTPATYASPPTGPAPVTGDTPVAGGGASPPAGGGLPSVGASPGPTGSRGAPGRPSGRPTRPVTLPSVHAPSGPPVAAPTPGPTGLPAPVPPTALPTPTAVPPPTAVPTPTALPVPTSVPTSVAPVPPAQPDPPTLSGKDSAITATWTAPADNGSAIDGYTVTLDATSTPEQTTSHTFTGLTNGTKYCVTVQAHNAAGDGPVSRLACGTPSADVPGAVPTATATLDSDPSSDAVRVTWSQAAAGQTPVTGYVVTARSANAPAPAPVTVRSAPEGSVNGQQTYDFADGTLTKGGDYTFDVAATNAAGNTGPAATTGHVLAATQPGAVTALTADAENGYALLGWSAGDSGGATDTFVVTLDGSPFPGAKIAGPSPGYTAQLNLTDDADHTFGVTARNSRGTSAQMTVDGRAGQAPSGVSNLVWQGGHGGGTLTWNASADQGGANANFSYRVNVQGENYGGSAAGYTTSAASPTATFSNMPLNGTYTFTVVPQDKYADGPGSTIQGQLDGSLQVQIDQNAPGLQTDNDCFHHTTGKPDDPCWVYVHSDTSNSTSTRSDAMQNGVNYTGQCLTTGNSIVWLRVTIPNSPANDVRYVQQKWIANYQSDSFDTC